MTGLVLDASARLALRPGEPGANKVEAGLDGSVMTTADLAEVVGHSAKLGAGRHDIEALLRHLPVRLIPAGSALSYEAGLWRSVTLEAGLSLGGPLLSGPGQARGCTGTDRRAALAADRRGCRCDDRADPLKEPRGSEEPSGDTDGFPLSGEG